MTRATLFWFVATALLALGSPGRAQTFTYVQGDTTLYYTDSDHTYYFRAQVTNLLPNVRTLRFTLTPYQFADTARQTAICTYIGCYPPRSGIIVIDQEYEALQQDDSVKFYIYNQISDWSQGFPIGVEAPLVGDYHVDITVQNLDNLSEQISFRISLLFGQGVVRETSTPLPSSVGLISNYPNPFNASTVLNFQVPTASPVQLSVYDLLGREVASPLSSPLLSPGAYTLNWSANSSAGTPLPAGRYMVRLTAGERSAVHAITLIR